MSASRILRSGNSAEKIRILQAARSIDDQDMLEEVVSRLDDEDIRVRGEAFGLLVLTDGDVSGFLLSSIKSPSKNIRGFVALVLANRNDQSAIPEIARLAGDDSSMVRSCAIGALGHLKAMQEADIFVKALSDPSQEVRNGAPVRGDQDEHPGARGEDEIGSQGRRCRDGQNDLAPEGIAGWNGAWRF